MPASPFSSFPLLLPPLTHRRPGTPGYHSTRARPGPGCSCGSWQGTREPLSLSTSHPWPNPSLPAPTCCQGSPPQEGGSPPHSDTLLWILPAGSGVVGAWLPLAGLPGKMEEALNHGGFWILHSHMDTSCALPAPVSLIPREKISGYLRIQ